MTRDSEVTATCGCQKSFKYSDGWMHFLRRNSQKPIIRYSTNSHLSFLCPTAVMQIINICSTTIFLSPWLCNDLVKHKRLGCVFKSRKPIRRLLSVLAVLNYTSISYKQYTWCRQYWFTHLSLLSLFISINTADFKQHTNILASRGTLCNKMRRNIYFLLS